MSAEHHAFDKGVYRALFLFSGFAGCRSSADRGHSEKWSQDGALKLKFGLNNLETSRIPAVDFWLIAGIGLIPPVLPGYLQGVDPCFDTMWGHCRPIAAASNPT